ncbi:unnamed protein product [Boreogadus saida]
MCRFAQQTLKLQYGSGVPSLTTAPQPVRERLPSPPGHVNAIKCQVSGLAANPGQHLHYSCAGFRAIVLAHSSLCATRNQRRPLLQTALRREREPSTYLQRGLPGRDAVPPRGVGILNRAKRPQLLCSGVGQSRQGAKPCPSLPRSPPPHPTTYQPNAQQHLQTHPEEKSPSGWVKSLQLNEALA